MARAMAKAIRPVIRAMTAAPPYALQPALWLKPYARVPFRLQNLSHQYPSQTQETPKFARFQRCSALQDSKRIHPLWRDSKGQRPWKESGDGTPKELCTLDFAKTVLFVIDSKVCVTGTAFLLLFKDAHENLPHHFNTGTDACCLPYRLYSSRRMFRYPRCHALQQRRHSTAHVFKWQMGVISLHSIRNLRIHFRRSQMSRH